MQLSYGILLGVIVLLLVLSLVTWVRRHLADKERERRLLMEKEDIFLVNCAGYGLSAREIEVVRLVLLGWRHREVGEKLFISEKTVNTHMQNVYAKVGAGNTLALLNKLYG